MGSNFYHVNLPNFVFLLASLLFLIVSLSFGEEIKGNKFFSRQKIKLVNHKINPEIRSSGILVKKLKRRLKTTQEESEQEEPQPRQFADVGSFLNQLTLGNLNRSSLFSSLGSGSGTDLSINSPVRFAIPIPYL